MLTYNCQCELAGCGDRDSNQSNKARNDLAGRDAATDGLHLSYGLIVSGFFCLWNCLFRYLNQPGKMQPKTYQLETQNQVKSYRRHRKIKPGAHER